MSDEILKTSLRSLEVFLPVYYLFLPLFYLFPGVLYSIFASFYLQINVMI